MTVTELLELLNKFKTIGYGDLDVVVAGLSTDEDGDPENLTINSLVLTTQGAGEGWIEIAAT